MVRELGRLGLGSLVGSWLKLVPKLLVIAINLVSAAPPAFVYLLTNRALKSREGKDTWKRNMRPQYLVNSILRYLVYFVAGVSILTPSVSVWSVLAGRCCRPGGSFGAQNWSGYYYRLYYF